MSLQLRTTISLAQIPQDSLHKMQASIAAIGLPPPETAALEALAGWLIARSAEAHPAAEGGAAGGAAPPAPPAAPTQAALAKALVSALLSVEPRETFGTPLCFQSAGRKLLQRYLDATALLDAPTGVHILVDDAIDERPTDLFTGDDLEGQLMYAITEAGPQEAFLSTPASWLYHLCINGAGHPANRSPITAFGTIQLMSAAAAPGAAAVGAAFKIPDALVAPLVASLAIALPPAGAAANNLEAFEVAYGIPPERQMSRQLNALYGPPPAPAAPIGAADMVALAALFGPQVAALVAMENAAHVAADAAQQQIDDMGLDPQEADNLMDDIVASAMDQAVQAQSQHLMGALGLI